MRVRSLGREDPLEEGMGTHPSILAWRIPRTEELRGESHGQRSFVENPTDRGASWRIPRTEELRGLLPMESQSQTRLK